MGQKSHLCACAAGLVVRILSRQCHVIAIVRLHDKASMESMLSNDWERLARGIQRHILVDYVLQAAFLKETLLSKEPKAWHSWE
jgi:hypothetical protein